MTVKAGSKSKLRGAPLGLIISGAIVALVTFALMFGGFNKIIKTAISMKVRLVNNSNTWNQWKTIPIPVYLKIRVFNITNPEELEFGLKPRLVEMGPYVYRETIFKVDITADEEADTVRYRQIRYYYFERELSGGDPDDIVTMINIPYVGVAKLAHLFTDVDFLLYKLDEMMAKKGERLTRREKVRDLLFDGFSVQNFVDLANDPMVQSAGEVKLPEKILDGKTSMFEDKNGTDDGWFVVHTGKRNSADFGRVVSHNGMGSFMSYSGEECNVISGTDGIIFQPFLEDGMTLRVTVPGLCRSITFVHSGTVYYDGIPAYRFRHPRSMYASGQNNPTNACFCPVNQTCEVEGVIPVAPCFDGAPLMLSMPHLLFVQPEVQELVEGLHPDPEVHWGYLDLNPTTGASLAARHRLQFNIEVSNWPAMPTFANVSSHIMPILWMEEGGTLEGPNKSTLKLLSSVLTGWSFISWLLLLIGIVLLPGLAFLLVFMRQKKDEVKLIMNPSGDKDTT